MQAAGPTHDLLGAAALAISGAVWSTYQMQPTDAAALNTALDLVREGVLAKHGVELIAASREAIEMAEDRELFRNAMSQIGLECPRSQMARSRRAAPHAGGAAQAAVLVPL